MLTDAQRAALALLLKRRAERNTCSPIPVRPAGLTELPLSYGQEQLWFIDRFAPGQAAYNIPLAIAVSGPLDPAALSRALDLLVARHETLRTRLCAGQQGRGVAVIDPPAPQPVELADLSGVAAGQRPARLAEFIGTRVLRPFALAADRLLRTWLLRLADDDHVLLIVVHHAVFDGWSAGVLIRELAALYRQESGGAHAELAELPVQFADYALWERDRLRGPMLAGLESYWRQVLDGYQNVRFPADRPRGVLDDFDGGLADAMTSPQLLADLRELSRREGTTLFVTLLAALHALVYRYTGQTDLVIGTVSANRSRSELAPLIGFLVNTLPIRADLSGDPPFTDLLAQVHRATIGAFAHQDLPFGKLVESLRVRPDPARSPLFQIAFSYADRDSSPVPAGGVEFSLTGLVVGINAAKFDLDFTAEARAGGLWFECSYKTALFDPPTVERLVAHFEVLLRGVAANPSARLSKLPVLTGTELHQQLVVWNDTAAAIPAACVHAEFERQAARTPDAVAAQLGIEQVCYAALNRRANQIARWLRGLGVGPEVLVGVCMTTGLRRLAALLGIWKAGGGYVPLDPALPAARLSFMIADTGLAVVLADDSTAASVPAAGAAVASLGASWAAISQLDDSDLAAQAVQPANVAYVIYTSGSTGQPKGVLVEHRHAVNFLHGMIGRWQIGPSDTVLQFASLSFDASVQEMFMPLLAGARMVLAPMRTLHSPGRLAALIRDRGVTFACLTPSVAALIGDEHFTDLRVLMCGGEELPSELVGRWLRPGLAFVNDYGPTEATITSMYIELDATTELPPPIGWPSRPNYRAYVLDEHLNPVPAGTTGELHIGGSGVTRGYLNRPALTAQRFIADPFRPGQRLYKTGDLARRRPDGTVVYAGRIDHQVKINGLRVELGEIETVLAAHPGVAQAVAAVTTTPAADRQITAYLRPRLAAAPDQADLRAHLARTLPGYMIPAHLIVVDEFPLTPSGKVDRAALPAPDAPPAGLAHAAPATSTETVLTRLYTDVLGWDRVGATDSFFDLGGSSLAVIRLIDLISAELGAEVSVAAIFLHPTPRQLAASIDAIRSGSGPAAGAGPLIELSAGAGRLPLFLIHPVGGTVFGYAQLAHELAGTFKVFGLQAPALCEPGGPASSLTAMVTDYASRILAAQPTGPFRLGGWSMGGVVAFEIARRLEHAGARVALLALLDVPFTVPDPPAPPPAQLAAMFAADAAQSLGWDPADLPDPARSDSAAQLSWLAARLGADDEDIAAVAARLAARLDVFGAHSQLIGGYQPGPPPVRAVTLIVSADGSPNAPAASRWPQVLSGPVRTVVVGSDHYAFLRPPLVTDIGAAIITWHARGEEKQ
jgi:amino acid adenylation domain-containing protein